MTTAIENTTVETERSLKEIFAERDRYARRGDVELLGTVIFCHTVAGTIDFRQVGPMLARLTDGPQEGQYVFLDEWQGLPAICTLLPDLCDQCRDTCADCHGVGKKRCSYLGCGGAGEIIKSWKPCYRCGGRGITPLMRAIGSIFPALLEHRCKQCEGRGEVPSDKHQCPNCKGDKTERCLRCQRSGRMPTGLKTPKDPKSGKCDACLGNGRKLNFEEQDWKKFAQGMLEGYVVLGPIEGMVLRKPEGEDPGIVSLVCDPVDGNLPVIALQKPDAKDGRMYLFGGRVQRVQ